MTIDSLEIATPLMIQFAFWASLVLTILKIAELVVRAIRQPALSLYLTREIFFRLIDTGEALFCNAVLLARNGPVLIQSVTATLRKIDQPEKSFPLEVIAFGEKVRGTGPLSDHYFHSTSPLAHIPESVPQRAVYLCVQGKYKDRVQQAVAEFRKQVLDYKGGLLSRAKELASMTQDQRAELLASLGRIVDESLNRMMDYIQLEPGRYELAINVGYQNPAPGLRLSRMAIQTAVNFFVGNEVRELLRSSLRQTLYVSATNMVFDQTQPVVYPEYQPYEVVEAGHKTNF